MTWALVIEGGVTLLGAGVAAKGAGKAAKVASGGADAASAEAGREFDIIRGDSLPRINIGNQAVTTLGAIYGHNPNVGAQPNALAGSTPYSPTPYSPGKLNSGVGALVNPYTISSKLGDARYVLDPAGKLFGNLFGGGHGDEKRNIDAFTKANQIYDLGNGMLSLADGTQFSKDKIQDVAGAWYGANYAPDGNQAGWQQKYGALIQKPANVATGMGASDGVPQGFTVGQGTPATTGAPGAGGAPAPDYSAFYKSPDYTFRRDEGMRDIGNSFSASGGAKSGNALKALAEFNSNLAAGGFNDYFSHEATLAGLGANATSTSAGAGVATGQIVGNALQNSADARASGVAGKYNAIGAGLSDAATGLGNYLAQRRRNPSSPYNYSFPG